MMSSGSQALCSNIKAGDRPSEDFSKFTDSKGNLIISDNLPLLDRRYRHIGLIGKGTFSQLLEAEDTLHPSKRHVAIKVMRSDIAEYGEEESKHLSQLNSKDTLDSTHVVRMSKTFYFGEHFCLVLELLHSTLLDQLNDERKRRPTKIPSTPDSTIGTTHTNSHSSTLANTPSTPKRVSTRSAAAASAPTTPTKAHSTSKSGKDAQESRGKDSWDLTHGKRKLQPSSLDEGSPTKKDRKEMDPIKQESPSSPSQQNFNLKQLQQNVNTTNNHEKAFLPIWFIRSIASQLIAAVGYLYQKGIIHADLKPENIMFRENPYYDGRFHEPYLKITDFGNAIALQKINVYYEKFEVQSLSYRAPEVVCGIQFGVEIEMWSIGCILAEMCNGSLLFHCRDKPALLHKMTDMLGPLPARVYSQSKFYTSLFTSNCTLCKNTTHFKRPDPFVKLHDFMCTNDPTFVDLVVQLLHYDPKKRPTPQQALQHPFFAPLFTFSIFGDASRAETEIKRINSSVSAKVLESRRPAAAASAIKKGCILFDEEKTQGREAEPEPEPELPVTREELDRMRSELTRAKLELAQAKSELEMAQSETAVYEANTRSQSGKIYDFAKITVSLKKEVTELSLSKQRTADLEKENEGLRAELAKRDSRLPNLVEENAKLKQKLVETTVRDLQGDLVQIGEKKTQADILRLEKEVEQLRGKMEDSKKETEKHRATIKQLQKESGVKEVTEQLEKENARLQSEIAHLKQAKDEIATALNTAQGAHRKRVTELNEEKMLLIKREQDALDVTETECERLRVAAKEERRELAERLAARETDLERQIAELRKVVDDAERTQNDLRDARAQNTTLREQVESARTKLAQAGKENAAQTSRAKKESESLKVELAKKGNELTSLAELIDELHAKNALAQKEVGTTKNELQKAEKESEKWKEKVKKSEKETEYQKKRIGELERDITDKEEELKQIEEEREAAKKKNADAEKHVARLERNLAKADENAQKLAAKTQKELARLQNTLDQTEEKLEEREKEKENLEQIVAERDSQARNAQKRYEDTKTESEKTRKENEEIKKEIEALKIANGEIQKEIEKIKNENAAIRKCEEEAKKQLRESENEKKQMKKKREEEGEKLKGEKEELQKERKQIEKDKEELQKREVALESERKTREKEKEELETGKKDLEKEKKKIEKEGVKLQKEKEKLEKRQVAQKKEKEEQGKRKEELKKGEEKLKKENDQIEKDKQEQKAKEEDLKRRESELRKDQKDIKSREDKLEREKGETERGKEDIKQREKEMENRKEDLKQREKEIENRKEELKQKEKEIENRKEEQKAKEEDLKQREKETKQRERETTSLPLPISPLPPSYPPPSSFSSSSPSPYPPPSSFSSSVLSPSPSLSSSLLSSSSSPSPYPLSRPSRTPSSFSKPSVSPVPSISPTPARLPTPSPSPLPSSSSSSSLSSSPPPLPSSATNEFFMAPSTSTPAKRFVPARGRLPTAKLKDPKFSATSTEDSDDVLLL